MSSDLLWRLLGPVWATLVLLAVVFPVTVPLVVLAVGRLHTAGREGGAARAAARRLFVPTAFVVLTWAAAALLGRAEGGAAPAWRSLLIVGLLAAEGAAALLVWRRCRGRPGTGAALLLQLWVGLVAGGIALWWVRGWASL